MQTATQSQTEGLVNFHQAAWDRYSPTTPPPGRVPDVTVDQAISEFANGSKALAHDILQSHPNTMSDANALNALGVMQMSLEHYDAATETLERAVALLDQRKAITLANLATVEIYKRNWHGAESLAEQSIKASSSIPHGWINLLFILARTEQYDELEKNFERMDTEFANWRASEEILLGVRNDILPMLRAAPTTKQQIELKLP